MHKVTLVKNGRPLKVNGEELELETTSVQEHVVRTNIKAFACVNACILTLSHTHTLKLPCL